MDKIILLMVLVSTVFLSACGKDDEPASSDAPKAELNEPMVQLSAEDRANAVAVVFGKPVSKELFQSYLNTRQHGHGDDVSTEHRQAELTQFLDLLVLVEGTELPAPPNAEGLSAGDLALAKLYGGAQQAVMQWQQDNPVDEALVRERYQAYANSAVVRDFKLRHLNPDDLAKAGELYDRLNAGTMFTDLEQQLIESNGATAAGDLGWVPSDAMTADVLSTINTLGSSGYTPPLESSFGGHIFLILGARDVAPPAFEDIAEQLRGSVSQQAFQRYVAERREAAKIEVF